MVQELHDFTFLFVQTTLQKYAYWLEWMHFAPACLTCQRTRLLWVYVSAKVSLTQEQPEVKVAPSWPISEGGTWQLWSHNTGCDFQS